MYESGGQGNMMSPTCDVEENVLSRQFQRHGESNREATLSYITFIKVIVDGLEWVLQLVAMETIN